MHRAPQSRSTRGPPETIPHRTLPPARTQSRCKNHTLTISHRFKMRNSPVCVSVFYLRNKQMKEKFTLGTIPVLRTLLSFGGSAASTPHKKGPSPGGPRALPPRRGAPLPGSEGRGLLEPVFILLWTDDHERQDGISILSIQPAHLAHPELPGL